MQQYLGSVTIPENNFDNNPSYRLDNIDIWNNQKNRASYF